MSAGGTTSTVSQEVDPAVRDRLLNLSDQAGKFVANTPFQQFPGQQVAGFQPLQSAAQQFLAQSLLGPQAQFFGFQPPPDLGPFSQQFQFQPFDKSGKLGDQSKEPTTGTPLAPDDPKKIPIDKSKAAAGGLFSGLLGGVQPNRDLASDNIGIDLTGVEPNRGGFVDSGQQPGGNFGFNPMLQPFQGVGQFQNQVASDVTSGLTGFNPQQVSAESTLGRIGQFQNPFQQQVIDRSIGDLSRVADISRQRARSGGAGAFGGDRQALRESEVERNFQDAAGRTIAQLRSQGFDTAAGLAGQDVNRQLQAQLANQSAGLSGAGLNLGAAGQLGQLGNDALRNTIGGASALNQFGTQQQGLAQNIINQQRSDFQQARNFPAEQFGLLQSLLSGIPVGFNQSTFQPGNAGAGFAGGALTGAGIGSSFGPLGTGIGALGGGLLGLF